MRTFFPTFPTAPPPRPEDLWIITKLNRTIERVNKALSEYEFSEAARELYEFIWSEFCDWYIEFSKIRLYAKPQPEDPEEEKRIKAERISAQATLLMVFEKTLRLLHPFMPYITEELWQALPTAHQESISITQYPQFNPPRGLRGSGEKSRKAKGDYLLHKVLEERPSH